MEYTKSYAELFANKDDFIILRKPLIKLLGSTDYTIIVAEIDSRSMWFSRRADAYQDHYFDGRWWMYDTYESWHKEYFPGLSIRTVKNMFSALRSSGIILQSKKFDYDKNVTRCWYSVNYELLSAMHESHVTLSDIQKQFPQVKGEDISEKAKKVTEHYVQNMHSTQCRICTPYNIYNNKYNIDYTENSKQRKDIGNFSEQTRDRQPLLYDLALEELSSDECAEKSDADRILNVIAIYDTYYSERTGRLLTCRPSQVGKIISKICLPFGTEQVSLVDLGDEEVECMIRKHFETRYDNCDYGILHFLTKGVLERRWYETKRELDL